MKGLVFILIILSSIFSGPSCLESNELNDYVMSLNIAQATVQELTPLNEDGLNENEKKLIDELSSLPQEIQINITTLNLLREIVEDADVTSEELDRFEDLDKDGLNNQEELNLGTDLLNPDSDWDHLNDGEEVRTYKTNPLVKDTDNDGFWDKEEVFILKSLPLNNNSPFTFIKDSKDSDGDGVEDIDDPEPFKANPYRETVGWLSQEMKEDALSCIVEGDKVQTFNNLCRMVFEHVPYALLEPGLSSYPNATNWQKDEALGTGLRDILINYYSYHQKVQRAPVCHDIACVYDIMADYIIEQTGWDEEGEKQGNNGVDCEVFSCLVDGGNGHVMCIVNINGIEYVADPTIRATFFRMGQNTSYEFPWENRGWDQKTIGTMPGKAQPEDVMIQVFLSKFDKRFNITIYDQPYRMVVRGLGTSWWALYRNQTPENEQALKVLYDKVKPAM